MDHSLENQKGRQACEILHELDLDCWLVWVRETSQITDPVLPLIFAGDLVGQSVLIFTRRGERIAIVKDYDAEGVETRGLFDRVLSYAEGVRTPLLEELRRLDPERIAIDYSENDVASDGLTVGMYRLLKRYLNKTPYSERLVSAEELIGRLRGRKLPDEIDRIQRAVEATEAIFDDAKGFLRVGQIEDEIHRFFHERMKVHGVTDAWNADHNPAVDAGPNKVFGHAGPTGNKTKAGHLLHFDFGVRYQGYCSDLQRMFFSAMRRRFPRRYNSRSEQSVTQLRRERRLSALDGSGMRLTRSRGRLSSSKDIKNTGMPSGTR